MKRRQVITAFGTLAIGTGTALGTGAFNATSSSSDAAMSIVTQGDNVNLDIIPGPDAKDAEGTGDNIDSGKEIENVDSADDFYDATSPDLSLSDLPKAVIHNPGQGMVNIQVFVQYGNDHRFRDLIEVINYDPNQDYDVGFAFTGFGGAVSSGVNQSDVPEIFKFYWTDEDDKDYQMSFNVDPSSGEDLAAADFPSGVTPPTIPSGDGSEVIDLKFFGSSEDGKLSGAYNATPGNFTGNDSVTNFGGDDTVDGKAKQIVDEVTAVANEAN